MKRVLQYFLCAFLIVGLGWGIVQLFEVRFAHGDIFSPYSTLRSDPLGAKAFCESLAQLPGMTVSRNETLLDRFTNRENGTLFYIGTNELYWSEKTMTNLEKFVNNGGRLVICFFPQGKKSYLVSQTETISSFPTPTPSDR